MTHNEAFGREVSIKVHEARDDLHHFPFTSSHFRMFPILSRSVVSAHLFPTAQTSQSTVVTPMTRSLSARTIFPAVCFAVTFVYENLILFRVHHGTRKLLDEAMASAKVNVRRHPPRIFRSRMPRGASSSAWLDLRRTILWHCSWSMLFSFPCFL